MSDTPDIEDNLMRMAAQKPRGLSGLYDAVAPLIYGLCITVSRDDAQAAQNMEMIFKRLWTGAYRFPATNLSGMAWIMSVVRGVVSDPNPHIWPENHPMDVTCDTAGHGPSDLLAVMYLRGWTYDDVAGHLGLDTAQVRDWVRWRDMMLAGDETPHITTRAAEYVLGVLGVDDARTFRTDINTDIGTAAAFVFWSERFSAIAATVSPIAPPDTLRAIICAGRGQDTVKSTRRRDIILRTFAFVGCVVFVIGSAYAYFRTDVVIPYVATLSGPDSERWGTVVYTSGTGLMDVTLEPDSDIQDGVDIWMRLADGSVVPVGAVVGQRSGRFTSPVLDPTIVWGGEFILRRHTGNKNARGAFLARGRFDIHTDDSGAGDLLNQLFLAFKAAAVLDLVPRPNNFL